MRKSLLAIAVGGVLAASAFTAAPAAADPQTWAPAHGYRAHHPKKVVVVRPNREVVVVRKHHKPKQVVVVHSRPSDVRVIHRAPRHVVVVPERRRPDVLITN